jgi:hypothetical protein
VSSLFVISSKYLLSLTLSLRIPGSTGYPGIQKIPFKICGWIGIAIYCFFHELEVISACFPVDMSAQRPVADDTLLKKLWMSFLPIRFLASGLNKKIEIIQTIDVFVHFIYLHQYPVKKTAAHWKFLRKKIFFPRFDEKISKMAAMRSLIMQNGTYIK